MKTPVGELDIDSVQIIDIGSISAEDAGRAGFESLDQLLFELDRRSEGDVYRIGFGRLHADPRIELRRTVAVGEDLEEALVRLERMDSRAADGPWTVGTLRELARRPGVRAGDLCESVGQEKDTFKRNVRKLKNLGLTESLAVGYRLSPRGEALLSELSDGSSNVHDEGE